MEALAASLSQLYESDRKYVKFSNTLKLYEALQAFESANPVLSKEAVSWFRTSQHQMVLFALSVFGSRPQFHGRLMKLVKSHLTLSNLKASVDKSALKEDIDNQIFDLYRFVSLEIGESEGMEAYESESETEVGGDGNGSDDMGEEFAEELLDEETPKMEFLVSEGSTEDSGDDNETQEEEEYARPDDTGDALRHDKQNGPGTSPISLPFLHDDAPPSFRDYFHSQMEDYLDVASAIATGFLKSLKGPLDTEKTPDVTVDLLDFLAAQKSKLLLPINGSSIPNPEDIDNHKQTFNKLLLLSLDQFSGDQLDDLLSFLAQNSTRVLAQLNNPLPLAIKLLGLSKADKQLPFNTRVLVACTCFDLILFHRLEFLGGAEEGSEDFDHLVDRFYVLLQPQLFSVTARDDLLERLVKLSKVLSQVKTILFFKKALRVACLVQPHSALWLIAFAQSLFLRHPNLLAAAIHVNAELRRQLAVNPAEHRQLIKALYGGVAFNEWIKRSNLDSWAPGVKVAQHVKLASRCTALEIKLLLRHHDNGVRTAAKDFVGKILEESSIIKVNRDLERVLELNLFQHVAKPVHSLLVRAAALQKPEKL
eukprot:Blabericola_migrator_1__8915@NODE_471_length_8214_cov_42_818706_g367_i0_p2_GENE_NODE_471_length_8214_cov_42_818706_g367_i0NODE_471_length_8214_cov_42_818706_g367_i0_p2_ORF_typecomplete_len593_score129_29CBF/PF03914_17/3_6e03CBF/PF03914_17/3e09Bac_globin/PF01152_21/11Bac_globin/PF01152_21/14Bac_globin/PF01152_21/9_6e03_NODE_471_length_8214_cov_42_818706_g367_i02041982